MTISQDRTASPRVSVIRPRAAVDRTISARNRQDVRVVIVEDHALFAESLELVLSIEGYDVRRYDVGEGAPASTGAVVNRLLRLRPQIVLLDLDLGRLGDGSRLVAPLARAGVDVVVVTGSTSDALWGEALWCGARTVLAKGEPLGSILGTVRRIHHRQRVLDLERREELIRHWRREQHEVADLRSRLDQLTRRESEVLGHLMRGRTVSHIAAAAVVSEATVRTQVKAVLAKLQVSSQIGAVGLAHRAGWRAPL